MLKETGRIIEITEVNGEKSVIVECISKSACKSCSSNDNCGVGVVAKGLSDKSHQISMPYKEGMEVNKQIELLVDNKDIVQSSLVVYIIPLILFVTTCIITNLLTDNEPLIIIFSLSALLIGSVIAKLLSAILYPANSLNKMISTK
ncbi:SoxR reducing system RseC family protein [Psychromonas sp. 14N.309.X.WAT.B.A12]|uniref:SoxR reducing system RseC family protein n=1 Tax=unclassified Psychromonas TaxID=2614957 RepID=UPI0025B0AFB6|nr:SoxR reducing system RseC family protein [Psychromonas sp. 14N.309.X.WAT.B.A12]MDN2664902.1 SoxR reducing system RseC family protein [Psychromonas sp. 14N.309.X.WAT.B.A12]